MKLQVSFDFIDLEKALTIASDIAELVDIIEVGTILIYSHGVHAIKEFKAQFPQKKILADTKIVDRSKEVVELCAQAGADWMTVMAGTSKNIIHAACTTAHDMGKKIMLDLLDSSSPGQSALEAKNLGVDALLFHQVLEDRENLAAIDKWDMVKGNSELPVFVSARIRPEAITDFIKLRPDGIIIGKSITEALNPLEEAQQFCQLIKG